MNGGRANKRNPFDPMRLLVTLILGSCATFAFAQTRMPEVAVPNIAAANPDRASVAKSRRKVAGKRANAKRRTVRRARKHSGMERRRTQKMLPPNLGFGIGF